MTRVRKNTPGRILFVGSGPGDPALLTVRARDVLTGAAMAFTDPDVDKGVVALVGIDMGRDVAQRLAEAGLIRIEYGGLRVLDLAALRSSVTAP